MTTTLADLIAGVRARSPLFAKARVPDKALGDFLSEYQRRLLDLAQQRDTQYLVRRAHVIIAATQQNLAVNVGAGESGAMPGAVVGDAPAIGSAGAGSFVELTFDNDENANVVILVPDRIVDSATASSITATGAGWTTNQFANRYVVIQSGEGVGQRRKISSNTADTLFVTQDFTTVPDTTSVFQVVNPVLETTFQMGGVTQLPALDSRVAYPVKLDADGEPEIDLTAPVVATFDAAIPLPPVYHVVGGTARFADDSDYTEPLTILSYGTRHEAVSSPAVYVLNEQVYLAGIAEDWTDIASVELLYVPVPLDLTAPTDLLTLPDSARTAMVAAGCAHAANRCAELGVTVNLDRYDAMAMEQEQQYLTSVGARHRGRSSTVREVC